MKIKEAINGLEVTEGDDAFNTLEQLSSAKHQNNHEDASQEEAQYLAGLLKTIEANRKRERGQQRLNGIPILLTGVVILLLGLVFSTVLSALFTALFGGSGAIITVGFLVFGVTWVGYGIYGIITGNAINSDDLKMK